MPATWAGVMPARAARYSAWVTQPGVSRCFFFLASAAIGVVATRVMPNRQVSRTAIKRFMVMSPRCRAPEWSNGATLGKRPAIGQTRASSI